MGISLSDAVRMMLVRVAAEKALPFEVRVPNAATAKAMASADKRRGKRFRSAKELFEDSAFKRARDYSLRAVQT